MEDRRIVDLLGIEIDHDRRAAKITHMIGATVGIEHWIPINPTRDPVIQTAYDIAGVTMDRCIHRMILSTRRPARGICPVCCCLLPPKVIILKPIGFGKPLRITNTVASRFS